MLGHWVDAGVILGVVLINAVIGFVQEGKAENALRAIRRMLSPRAMVLRTGQRVTLPAEQLVPGDVVLLQSGDKVPADLAGDDDDQQLVEGVWLTHRAFLSRAGFSPSLRA